MMGTLLFGNENKAAAVNVSSISAWFLCFLLVLCLIQFFSAWIFPPSSFNGLQSLILEKRFAVPFQYMLWLSISFATLQLVYRSGASSFYHVLKPFFPILLIGLVASAFGSDPFSSLRILILWILMAFSAVVIGTELQSDRCIRVALLTFIALLIGSIFLALLFPTYGTQQYGRLPVWRGLFTNKNQFGWFATLALIFSANINQKKFSWLPRFGMFLSVVCLLGSGSKGALASCLVVIGYGYLIKKLSRLVTPGFGVSIIVVVLFSFALIAAISFTPVLELLGRDASLTGRTTIWNTYFQAMVATPWLGQGPGSYTTLSSITVVLANKLSYLGGIVTPHSSFLGAFGDAGLFGLLSFTGLLVYLSLIRPMWSQARSFNLSGAISFLILISGIAETHDVFTAGGGWFLLILSLAMEVTDVQSGNSGGTPASQNLGASSHFRNSAA